MGYRFHILGVPHTISIREYSACAFTQKIVKMCKMLKARGHTVIHYGHEDSVVDCDEHVTVTRRSDLQKSYGNLDWRKQGVPTYRLDDHVYKEFFANTIAALHRRKQRGDFLLCPFGGNHKPVADAHPDLIACEPGIGYPDGGFAKFRVFESYSIMHASLGIPSVKDANHNMWYDVVIPNYYDLDDFEFSAVKDDYFLFLGRVGSAKGIHIALQIVEAVGGHLIVAGPGGIEDRQTRTDRPISEYVKVVGVVGPEERKRLIAGAKATLAPSMFLEPFCGVQVESMLSGTPVISSDWGAFSEVNIHGVTGYRCRTFEHFTWAARNIHNIDPHACRAWAERNYSLDRVADMYDEYFYSVRNIFSGKGWYADNLWRSNLDWLNRYLPAQPAAHPLGSLTPVEAPLIKAENLFRQPGPPHDGLAYNFVVRYNKNMTSLLAQLCDKYGSDKGEIAASGHPYPWPSHTYTDFISRHFDHCREHVKKVFECGLGTNNPNLASSMGVNGKPGASLRVWRDYFPSAQIYGADIDKDILFEEDRIKTFYMDQTNLHSIQEFWKLVADGDFDLMVDDGLHTFEAGICLFNNSIEMLAQSGIYVIEDVYIGELEKYREFFSDLKYRVDFIQLNRPAHELADNSLVVVRL